MGTDTHTPVEERLARVLANIPVEMQREGLSLPSMQTFFGVAGAGTVTRGNPAWRYANSALRASGDGAARVAFRRSGASKDKENKVHDAQSLARLIVSMAGAMPMAHMATARAQDLNAYCAKVGNDDREKSIPAALVPEARRLFNVQSADNADFVRRSTVYRCMGGSVWLCNHGANIPCAKGDTRRVLLSVTTYGKENPDEDFVPMVVTGHDTIHSWECAGGKARIKQSEKVDSRGFVADQWERME
jgi:hypothetical protein